MNEISQTFKEMFKNNQVAFGIVLGLGAIISALLLANAIKAIKSNDYISVTGSAEKMVKSDSAKWTFSLSRSASQTGYTAVSKSINDDMENVAKYLVNRGVKREAITVQPLTSIVLCESQNQVMYGPDGTQRCAGNFTYALSQKIIVESDDVTMVRDLSLNAANALSVLGIQIITQSVDYYYTKLADLRVELLGEAAKNAQERAGALAQSSGNKIGSLTQATQGVFQITQVNSTDVNDYGTYDTSTIDKKVTAVVRASFTVR